MLGILWKAIAAKRSALFQWPVVAAKVLVDVIGRRTPSYSNSLDNHDVGIAGNRRLSIPRSGYGCQILYTIILGNEKPTCWKLWSLRHTLTSVHLACYIVITY